MKTKLSLFFLIAALLIGYANCHSRNFDGTLQGNGTDTGNVGTPGPQSAQLESALCAKLTACFSPVLMNCESKVLSTPNVVSALGLNQTQYQNLQAVLTAVTQGQLKENSQQKTECLQQIGNLSCQNQLVLNSYNINSIEDLSQIFKLLSATPQCTQYLSP
jgi:hypothetical protein